MNWLDFAIIGLVGGTVFAAYSSGLIREVVTLVAAITGIVVASILYDDFAAEVLTFVDEDAAPAAGFLILSASVYLLGQILAYVLKKGAALVMLGWADHIGGAFFGLLKGLLIAQILLIMLAAYPALGLDGAVAGSELAPYFIDDVSFMLELLPGEFKDRVDQFLAPPGLSGE